MSIFALLALLLPQPATAQETGDERAVQAVERRLKAAAASDDRAAIIGLIDFPLRVNRGDSPVHTRYYRSPRAVLQDYRHVFTPAVQKAMRSGDYQTMGSGRAMIDDGIVWFGVACRHAICPEFGPLHIKAINLDSILPRR